jgi:DNA repair protein RadC
VAEATLHAVGGLPGLAHADGAALLAIPGIGPSRARRLMALGLLLGRRHVGLPPPGPVLPDGAAVGEAIAPAIGREDVDAAWVVVVDRDSRRLAVAEVARGLRDIGRLSPAALLGPALRGGGAAFYVVIGRRGHGSPERLGSTIATWVTVAEWVGLPLLDCIEVRDGECRSLLDDCSEPLAGFRRAGAG